MGDVYAVEQSEKACFMMRHWRESGVRLCRQLVHPKPVEWQVLSQWRTALMGLAMIFVVLFHMRGRQDGSLAYAMVCCGNIGVDMFLFLSGIGLSLLPAGYFYPCDDDCFCYSCL